ncbi:hypothetical protein ES705_19944 [subsurface metagenome]
MSKLAQFYQRTNSFLKNNPLLTNVFGGLIVAALLALINIFYAKRIIDFLYQKIRTNVTWRAFFFSALTTISFFWLFTATVVYRMFRDVTQKKELAETKNELKRLDASKLVYVLRSDTEAQIQEGYKIVKRTISSRRPNCLDFLLTTGYEPISMDSRHEGNDYKERYSLPENGPRLAVFHKYMKTLRVKTRILLLNPLSELCTTRGKKLLNDPAHYRQLISRTIAYLELLNNNQIQYGFFEENPVWKIIKTDKYTFVQAVPADSKSRDEFWFGFENRKHRLTDGFDVSPQKSMAS